MLKRKTILFNVIGYSEIGLGHVYRTLLLANELVNFNIIFITDTRSDMAIDQVKANNYPIIVAEEGGILDQVLDINPCLIINDVLDTTEAFMLALKRANLKVINFEDLGNGAKYADRVINALYPESSSRNVLSGPQYFCLRDEFLFLKDMPKQKKDRVLLTFGGVDEGNITLLVLNSLLEILSTKGIYLDIVLGAGYAYLDELESALSLIPQLNYSLTQHTKRISEHMLNADLAITSGGRTVLELAALQVPTIVICQNMREMTHSFAESANGVLNLGHYKDVTDLDILDAFENLFFTADLQKVAKNKMQRMDLTQGKKRVIKVITDLIGE